MSKDKGLSRPAWAALMIVSGGAVAFMWAVVHVGRAIERLCDSTDQVDDDDEPGPLRDYMPSEFSSLSDD